MRLLVLVSFGFLLIHQILIAPELMGDEMKIFTVTRQDSGKEISVKRGDIVQIELTGLGAAGYQWHLQKFDEDVLRLVEKETKSEGGKKPGAPGMIIWRLRATKKGETEILMSHYRPWEGEGKAIDTFRIRIRIF